MFPWYSFGLFHILLEFLEYIYNCYFAIINCLVPLLACLSQGTWWCSNNFCSIRIILVIHGDCIVFNETCTSGTCLQWVSWLVRCRCLCWVIFCDFVPPTCQITAQLNSARYSAPKLPYVDVQMGYKKQSQFRWGIGTALELKFQGWLNKVLEQQDGMSGCYPNSLTWGWERRRKRHLPVQVWGSSQIWGSTRVEIVGASEKGGWTGAVPSRVPSRVLAGLRSGVQGSMGKGAYRSWKAPRSRVPVS